MENFYMCAHAHLQEVQLRFT